MRLPEQAERDLARRIPTLLTRARALLKLPGGPPDQLTHGELKRAAGFVSELHQGLVGERALAQVATYERPVLLGAYLLWWWPQSYARVRAALALAPLPFEQPSLERSRSRVVQVLDLGSGPGPAAIAIADHLAHRGLRCELLAIDGAQAALHEAHQLEPSLHTQRLDLVTSLAQVPQRPFDLISTAHLLSELPGAAAERAVFLRSLLDGRLAEQGALLVLEPALRETGRALLEVRDALLSGPAPLRALAPCLTQQPCPALHNPRDWCTAEVSWSAPPHLLQLSRELGLHAEAPLSFAPLLLARSAPPPPAGLWRVVGVPQPEKGKRRLFVCADRGRLPVARLDREAGEGTRAFDEATRGELLRLRGLTEKGDGLRLGADGQAELVAGEAAFVDRDSASGALSALPRDPP